MKYCEKVSKGTVFEIRLVFFSFVDRRKSREQRKENKVERDCMATKCYYWNERVKNLFSFFYLLFFLVLAERYWKEIKESNIGFLIKGFFTFFSFSPWLLQWTKIKYYSVIKLFFRHISCDAREGKIYGCENIWLIHSRVNIGFQ